MYSLSEELPVTMKDLGVLTNDIPSITKIALTRGHCKVNPRPVEEEEVNKLLLDCFNEVAF